MAKKKDDFTDFAGHPDESRAWIRVKPSGATVTLGDLTVVGTLLVPFAALDCLGSGRFDGGLANLDNQGLLCWERATDKVLWLVDTRLVAFAESIADLRIGSSAR
jgi:hypothetical protein